MQGLESLLGTDLDGPPRDLDVSLCLGITWRPLSRLATCQGGQEVGMSYAAFDQLYQQVSAQVLDPALVSGLTESAKT